MFPLNGTRAYLDLVLAAAVRGTGARAGDVDQTGENATGAADVGRLVGAGVALATATALFGAAGGRLEGGQGRGGHGDGQKGEEAGELHFGWWWWWSWWLGLKKLTEVGLTGKLDGRSVNEADAGDGGGEELGMGEGG